MLLLGQLLDVLLFFLLLLCRRPLPLLQLLECSLLQIQLGNLVIANGTHTPLLLPYQSVNSGTYMVFTRDGHTAGLGCRIHSPGEALQWWLWWRCLLVGLVLLGSSWSRSGRARNWLGGLQKQNTVLRRVLSTDTTATTKNGKNSKNSNSPPRDRDHAGLASTGRPPHRSG